MYSPSEELDIIGDRLFLGFLVRLGIGLLSEVVLLKSSYSEADSCSEKSFFSFGEAACKASKYSPSLALERGFTCQKLKVALLIRWNQGIGAMKTKGLA